MSMTKEQILEMFNTIKYDEELKVEFFELVSESHDFVEMILSEQEGYDDEDGDGDYDNEETDEETDEEADEDIYDNLDENNEIDDLSEDASIKNKTQLDVDDN